MRNLNIILTQLLFIGAGSAQQPLQTILEVSYPNSNYALGTGMLGLGDINNDGNPDFAVSAGNIGKTFIYFGGAGVLDSVPDIIIRGGGPMRKGDINGDSHTDLVVSRSETLYVYFGKTATPFAIDTIPGLIIPRETTGGGETEFGQHLAIGDLNSDGFDDLVVSADLYSSTRGRVYVFLGRSSPVVTPDFVALADSLGSFYGSEVKVADINGDGVADLAVSGNEYSRRGFATIDIYYGREGWTFSKNTYDQSLDSREGGYNNLHWFNLFDVNSDGRADISFTYGDSAYFFYGRTDSLHHSVDLIMLNPDTTFYSGFSGPGSEIGDINKDGKKDFVMRLAPSGGAQCIDVYLGNSIPSTKPVLGRCKAAVSVFDIVVPLGDVNDDSVNDFGSVSPRDVFDFDGYFIVFSGDSNFVTSVKEKGSTMPDEGRLSQNYPNPFNPETLIEYKIAKRGSVSIKIYDTLGREIKKLVEGQQSAGTYKTVWNGTGNDGSVVAAGAYFYRIVFDGNEQETKKLILLR